MGTGRATESRAVIDSPTGRDLQASTATLNAKTATKLPKISKVGCKPMSVTGIPRARIAGTDNDA